MKNPVEKLPVLSLIPHRPPLVCVDRLLNVGPDVFESDFLIPLNHLFLRQGLLQEPALLENIAQTCAAGFGYLARHSGESPKPGYIGAISRVQVSELPKAGETVTTRVQVLYRMGPVVMVHGTCFREGVRLLEGEIKLVI